MGTKLEKDSLAFLLNSSARMLNTAFERRIADAGLGLTPGEARALLTVAIIDGSKQSDIAARLGIEPMTICAYIDKLQSLDLVERQQAPNDRRSKRIVLTENADEMLKAVRQEIDQLLRQATQGLSEADIATFRNCLQALRENLQPEQPSQSGQ
ncbi:MarR family winged helix-turn-helix transcriptional regulator [Agrobacterium tumefaciens]|uniref:MarR family winged helix-turn-helix transcriptional regulator n=1 Tax=Agrobacterium tumefaciens TaxID=358 RepID=UPI0021D34BA6|nr:MarR family winged helix-turn-helix transcriptional regulator [Agrobacterium tumefaciens]UXS02531.1 winged helix-turn-helix transcriptional regulator [Agrobacterium tumefaciens]